jgi:hypothetical protein
MVVREFLAVHHGVDGEITDKEPTVETEIKYYQQASEG